jgi:hypothetical protein
VPAHCTQVSTDGTRPSSTGVHSPPSSCTSTASMPVCCAQATPPTRTAPAMTRWFESGTSIRDWVRTGPSSAHPLSVQKAVKSSKRLTSRSTTHLVAETYP